jgi:hypothetical protein
MDRIGNVPLTPVLGVEPSRYSHVPLIATTPVLWGVWCLPANLVKPRRVAVWRTGSPSWNFINFNHLLYCPPARYRHRRWHPYDRAIVWLAWK